MYSWDRTAQLSALTMLMFDPFYRTIRGFAILIEKEWLSAGHKVQVQLVCVCVCSNALASLRSLLVVLTDEVQFQDRMGHLHPWNESEMSPVFLQFVDCVWQLTRQYPCEFEFNSKMLIYILDHVSSGTYGTFLCNTEQQRRELNLERATASIWSYILAEVAQFTNPCYAPPAGFSTERTQVALLRPVASMKRLELWQEYYLRYDRSLVISFAGDPKSVIDNKLQQARQDVRRIEAQLQTLSPELGALGSAADVKDASSSIGALSASAAAFEQRVAAEVERRLAIELAKHTTASSSPSSVSSTPPSHLAVAAAAAAAAAAAFSDDEFTLTAE